MKKRCINSDASNSVKRAPPPKSFTSCQSRYLVLRLHPYFGVLSAPKPTFNRNWAQPRAEWNSHSIAELADSIPVAPFES